MEPSLNAIRTFEVAARQLSFAGAARILGVQPPAVSRQVAELESNLGVALFVRSKPRLKLTSQGQELYRSVRLGLNEIRQGCEKIRDDGSNQTVRVITSISLASCWLLKRLVTFYQLYPDINLELTTRDSTLDIELQEVDIAVSFELGNVPGIEARQIFSEKMIAVCKPGYLPEGKLLTPKELESQPLLHYMEPTHRQDWQRLMGSAGCKVPAPGRGMTFNSYIVYLQAAINGGGIATGWEYLLDDYFEDGSLCRASDLTLETNRGYFCYLTEKGANKDAARQFMDWVCGLVD